MRHFVINPLQKYDKVIICAMFLCRLFFGFLLELHFALLLYGFASNLEAKQIVCFYIDTFSFGAKSASLISLSSR